MSQRSLQSVTDIKLTGPQERVLRSAKRAQSRRMKEFFATCNNKTPSKTVAALGLLAVVGHKINSCYVVTISGENWLAQNLKNKS